MSITIEAVDEADVFKPLSPVENLKEHDKIQNLIDEQRPNRIQIHQALRAK